LETEASAVVVALVEEETTRLSVVPVLAVVPCESRKVVAPSLILEKKEDDTMLALRGELYMETPNTATTINKTAKSPTRVKDFTEMPPL